MTMRTKVLWATVAITAAAWFGCAGHGRDQNYKILNEDRDMVDTEPRKRGSMGDWFMPTMAKAYADAPLETKAAAPEAKAAEAKPVKAKSEPAPSAAPKADAKPVSPDATAKIAAKAEPKPSPVAPTASDDKPSLNGLDRSHWAKISVTAESGKTEHYPYYYADLKEPCTRVTEKYKPAGEGHDAEINAALDGSTDHYKCPDHIVQTIEQPVKFCLDTMLLPARMVITPPWQTVTTP